MKNSGITGLLLVAASCSAALTGCLYAPARPDPAYAATPPVAATPPAPTGGAIYTAGHGMSLFEDQRARQVGDILTIILSENNSANKSANTSTSKENDVSIDNPTLFGKQLPVKDLNFTLDQELTSAQEFSGQGSSTQSNTVSATITVTVAQVLPNGNLAVRGEKLMTINQGDEYVRISGIVRQRDITAANTVLSTQVANVRLVYGGKGAVADANANGWAGRFFQSKWWPF